MDTLKQIYKTVVVVLGLILTLISIPSAWVAISAHLKNQPEDPLFTIFPAFLNWLNGNLSLPRWLCILLALIVIARSASLVVSRLGKSKSQEEVLPPEEISLSQLSRYEKMVLFGFIVVMESRGSSCYLIPKELADSLNESVAQIEAAFLHLIDKNLVTGSLVINSSGHRYYLTIEGKKFIAAKEDVITTEVEGYEMKPSKN